MLWTPKRPAIVTRRALITGAAALATQQALAQGVPGLGMGPGLMNARGGPTTWNPLDMGSGFTLSNGNLTWATSTGTQLVRATNSRAVGAFYLEYTIGAVAGSTRVGFANAAQSLASSLATAGIAYEKSGSITVNGSSAKTGTALNTNDIVGAMLDATNKLVYFARNGSWQGSNPSTGSGGIDISAISGPYFPAGSLGATNAAGSATANFGASAFSFTVPTGASAWG